MITLNTNPGLLRTAVYERILSDLQQGAIAPGETISLNKLAETLNISKTPLRDALLELQAEGFVTLYPQRGVMVNALSEEEKREIYEVCGVLDGQVIRNVFPRVTPEHVARLKDLNARMYPGTQDISNDEASIWPSMRRTLSWKPAPSSRSSCASTGSGCSSSP